MDWKTIEKIAENPERQWFVKQADIVAITGRNRRAVAAFLSENNIPWYGIGKGKSYFLPEVLEAIERKRWAAVQRKESSCTY